MESTSSTRIRIFPLLPPEQQSEQPAANELGHRFHRRLGRFVRRQHHLDLGPNQIDQHLLNELLDGGTATLADHRSKHRSVLVRVKE
jgi:hypothetical protein